MADKAAELPDALILCGGLGTRLQAVVAGRPKGLAQVRGRAFLDILIDELMREGLRRFILCTGHGAAQIAAHFQDRRDAEFVISAEDRPLGTGGAVAHALPQVRGDPFLLINGDSFCRVSYAELLASHKRHGALISVVVTQSAGRADVGAVNVDATYRILEFSEKPGTGGYGHVNAGIYVVQRQAMLVAPFGDAFSLERELMPAAVQTGRCHAFVTQGPLIDIGTPDRLRAAQDLLRQY